MAVYRSEELLSVINDPSGEGRPGDLHPIEALLVLLLPVQRIAVTVFLIHDPGYCRCRRHALHHVGLTVLSLYDIGNSCIGLLTGRAAIALRIVVDDFNVSGNHMDLLTDKLLADVLQLCSTGRADALVFIDIEVFLRLPAVFVFFLIGLLFLPLL